MPKSLQIIGAKAFSNSGRLYYAHDCFNIEIPESVVQIGYEAFAYIDHLKDVRLHPTLKKIGKSIFEGCNKSFQIIIDKGSMSRMRELLPEYENHFKEEEK